MRVAEVIDGERPGKESDQVVLVKPKFHGAGEKGAINKLQVRAEVGDDSEELLLLTEVCVKHAAEELERLVVKRFNGVARDAEAGVKSRVLSVTIEWCHLLSFLAVGECFAGEGAAFGRLGFHALGPLKEGISAIQALLVRGWEVGD